MAGRKRVVCEAQRCGAPAPGRALRVWVDRSALARGPRGSLPACTSSWPYWEAPPLGVGLELEGVLPLVMWLRGRRKRTRG